MRLALGAARRIVLRQLLTESLLLSAIGGVLGMALATVLVRAAAVALPDSLPRLNEIAIGWPLFAAALATLLRLACFAELCRPGQACVPMFLIRCVTVAKRRGWAALGIGCRAPW